MTVGVEQPAGMRPAVTEQIPVKDIAAATIDAAKRQGLFWRLRPGTVAAAAADGTPRVLYLGDTTPVPVTSLIGALPVGADVMAVLSPPSGHHVVGYSGTPPVGVRMVAYYPRRTNKTGITAEAGLLRVDDIPLEEGHLYRLRLSGVSFNNVATRLFMRIRGSTTGTAGLGSGILAAATHTLGAAGTTGGTREVVAFLLAAANGTLSALCSLQADSSVNTVNAATESPNEFVVEDMGTLGTVVTAGVNL